MQEALQKLKEKIDSILEYNRVLIINDYDIDSCASASILWRILRMNNIEVEHLTLSKGIENKIIEKLKEKNPEKIVVVDYVPTKELTEELKNFSTTILDHHTHEEHLNVLDYYTTSDFDVKYAALSYWLYLISKEYEIKNVEWLAELGCFWDKCMENTEFYEENVYSKKMDKMLPFNIFASYTQTIGAERLVQLFNNSSDIEEALDNIKNTKGYEKSFETFKHELGFIEASKKEYPEIKLNIFDVNTKFKHMRVFVDYITYQNEGTHIFVLNEIIRYKFSFRTSLEINLVKIIRNLSEKIPEFGGGGHPKACGAMLKSNKIENFLEEFLKEYKKAISN